MTLSDEDQLAEDKYRKELMLKTSDEIGELVAIERQKVAQEQESARFFNAEEANANVDHWAKMPYWSVDEAVALLLGKEPEIVNWKKLKGMVVSSPFSKTYSKLLDLANRSVAAGIIQEDDLPNRFLQWAEEMNHDVPRALVDACAKYSSELVPWKVLYEKLAERFEHELARNESSAASERPELGPYWSTLESKALFALENFAAWKSTQRKVQKTGNLHDWIAKKVGAGSRETEIIKKVLSEKFNL